LERPAALATGDHYILRLPSPSATLGGGVILSPHPTRRWKRFDPDVLRRFETLANGAPDDILLATLARTPFLTPRQLSAQSELDADAAAAALAELLESGAVIALPSTPDPLLITLDGWNRIVGAIRTLTAAYHDQFPLRAGIPRGELRSRLQAVLGGAPPALKLFNLLLDRAQADGVIEASESVVRLAGFSVALSPAQQAAVEQMLAAFAAAPAAPPNTGDTLALLGGNPDLLEMLIEQGVLVRLGGDVLFRTGDLDTLMARVLDHLRAHGTITMAEARDLLGTSRKYVQVLLEEMDARRLTRREGDLRVLR
jgi:selenocysteine-specific elongation factor